MTIGKRIKQARESKGLKQNFVAKRAGVTPEHLSSVERDINDPSKTLVNILEIIIGVELNF